MAEVLGAKPLPTSHRSLDLAKKAAHLEILSECVIDLSVNKKDYHSISALVAKDAAFKVLLGVGAIKSLDIVIDLSRNPS